MNFLVLRGILMDNNIRAEANGLSIAGLVFGILAVLSSFTVVFIPFFASMAITFSLLSRGNKKMNVQAIAGNILAIVSIIIGLLICSIILVLIIGGISELFSSGSFHFDYEYISPVIENITGGTI